MKKQHFGSNIEQLCKKGYYPYEWVDDVAKLNNVGLPPIQEFIQH